MTAGLRALLVVAGAVLAACTSASAAGAPVAPAARPPVVEPAVAPDGPRMPITPTPHVGAGQPTTAAGTCTSSRLRTPGDWSRTITFQGTRRSYTVRLPAGYDGRTARPAVFLLHGLGRDGESLLRGTGMGRLADEEGFIVVAPEARGMVTSWDVRTPSGRPGSDVDFIDAVLADVREQACLDDERTHVAGFSNGAVMAMNLACRPSSPFASYAAVAGPWFDESCRDAPATSMLSFHGTQDEVVGYSGAKTVIGTLPPVRQTMQDWAEVSGCLASEREDLSRRVRHFTWAPCAAGVAVELYQLVGNGHVWPGAVTVGRSKDRNERTDEQVDATTLIWEFFERHPLRS